MTRKPLHYSRQLIDETDISEVARVLRGDFLTTGPEVNKLESLIAEKVDAKYCVVCSSGTAALHLTALALEFGEGDALVTSPITFVATANASRFCGGGVYLTDINPTTGNMDPEALEKTLSHQDKRGKIKAVYPVHYAGQAADMEAICKIAQKHKIKVIEDASHALGASYEIKSGENYKVGSCKHSDMTVFSFHPVKPITTGEGGAITTNDPILYQKLLRLRAHGIERTPENWKFPELGRSKNGQINPWYYEMQELGWNYRISDFQCALGSSQLRKISHFVEKRNEIAKEYDTLFSKSKVSKLLRPLVMLSGGTNAYHIYVVLIDFEKLKTTKAELMNALKERHIGTQVNYIPVHFQPYYRTYFSQTKQVLPAADNFYEKALSIPISAGMSKEDVAYVVAAFEELLI